MNSLIKDIIGQKDLKQNLLVLKDTIKDTKTEGSRKDTLLRDINENIGSFLELLENEDPKIRKNTAIILGFTANEAVAEKLFEAYRRDSVNYNKATYLEAIGHFDFEKFIPMLNERREALINADISFEEKKHLAEEMKVLNRMLIKDHSHSFTGYGCVNEAALTTNRNFKQVTMKALKGIPHKEYTAGVMVKTANISEVLKVRTFEEILFVPELSVCSKDPATGAAELIEGGLYDYIAKRHSDPEKPFFFRVDYRTKDEKQKSLIEKKFATELELGSSFRLVNSVSDYDIELRLLDLKEGSFKLLLKFYTLEDRRFAYRKESVAQSLKPYLAALLNELAADYLKPNAAVIDPFCGTGSLPVEREYISPVRIAYCIDIFKEAVEKSAINIKGSPLAGKCELVTRDFLEFHHDHKFNELITEMPYVTGKKTLSEIDALYKGFFVHVRPLLEEDFVMVICSRNRDLLRKYALLNKFVIKAEFEISKMEGSYLFIIK